eukprot:TRINITY_DN5075_c0_g1_i4.p1 TRINITY_DN5075_c0_g1~~TRINITY_DN5075_c0_g1_i4.p1  ORF type:complete len:377 (-),score=74.95 TRINITY_DN5075_c0_g1_i4:390-1520(-)
MRNILPDLYMHYLSYPSSFINPIYGCYELYLSETGEIEPQYFVLMKNVFDVNRSLLPEKTEILCFDIKGSSAGRKVLKDPRKLLEDEIGKDIQKQTLKDADFFLSFKRLDVTPMQSRIILKQLERDTQFFAKFMLIDYSLLLYLMNIPYKNYKSTRQGEVHKIEQEKGLNSCELILAEKNVSQGKSEIVIEERDRAISTVYRIANPEDIETIRHIDDDLKAKFSSQKSNLYSSSDKTVTKYKSSRLSSVANEPKDFSDKSITKRSVINFPKIIVTENLGDYSIDKAHSKAVNPFSAQVDPVQEELKLLAGDINFQNVSKNLVGENEVVKKKITPSQEVFLPKVNEELKITNTRNDGFGMEGGSGTSSYQVELIVEV